MEEDTKQLRDYVAALRRRGPQIAAVIAILFGIAVVVAVALPPVYKSTATILIEQQEIPPDLVRSTISSYADQRIQSISQQVMTRANLTRIVEKYDLYRDLRATKATEAVLERLSRDIRLDILKADVVDQRSGAKTSATIAFNLSYSGETPERAQQVASELVTLFLSENLKGREQKTAETSTFLAQEAARLGKQVSEIEADLAAFKSRNLGRLPELAQLNMQMRDRADSEIKEVDRQMSALEERRFYLDAQLAQIKPNTPIIASGGERILDASERLRALEAQYASLSGGYSESHPDIARMRREIESLRKEAATGDDGAEGAKRLIGLQAELAAAREKYSDTHPDVVKLKRAIAPLEAQRTTGAQPSPRKVPKPENPAYIALQAQLESTQFELKSLRAKRKELQAKIAGYERRLEETPQVERKYLDLTRDHEAAVARYREIKTKQMQAQIGEELERDRKGERFSLIDPPQVPERPSSPNRPAILLLGAILALGGGVGVGGVLETADNSVRGPRMLARVVKAPVLAGIPYLRTDGESRRRSHRRWMGVLLLVAAVVAAAVIVDLAVMPLDVLWFKLMRVLESHAAGGRAILQ